MKIDINNIKLEDVVRLATTMANSRGTDLLEDAGCGMTNVYMPALGFDNAIVQCYPNGDYKDVWIVLPKNDDNPSVTLSELPELLQFDVVEKYCAHLGFTITIEK